MQTRKRKSTTQSPRLDTITQGEELEKFSNHDDEAKDPSYNHKNKRQRGHKKGSRQSLPDSVKLELEKTALGKCCTLTLDPLQKPCAVEIAHVVPAASSTTRLRALQDAWYMNDLPNVDSPANLMYLRVDWHRAFNANRWAILPTEELLLEIAGATFMPTSYSKKGDLFSQFSKCLKDKSPKDKYQLLWLGKSDTAKYPPLLRRKDSKTSDLDSDLVNIANRRDISVKLADLQTCNTTLNALAAENEELRGRNAHLLSRSSAPSLPSPEGAQEKLAACQDNNSFLRLENAALHAQVDALFAEARRLSLLGRMMERETVTGHLCDSISATLEYEVSKLLELALHYHIFSPPYTDFPAFHSHVHPFFVIVNAGSKLLEAQNPSQFGPAAEILLEIYRQWFKLPLPLKPPQIAGGEDEDEGDDGRSSHTSQMDDDGSSEADESQRNGSRKSGRVAKQSGRASNSQNRAGNIQAAPCDAVDVPMLDPCTSSAGTPSLVPDSSVNALGSHSLDEAEELEDVDTYVSEWLAGVDAAPPQEDPGDPELDEYIQEPSREVELHKWQEWATAPPKMPGLLRDYHDTSKLTSYHWSLYHESVNLMAPTGSHRLPLNAETPYDPDDVHKYDVWRDDD
ncbi:hypothetical protein PC9H_008408 [Pleurotus ostreatus]|uniref:HNH nuclease domain-containing protein n=1 Tax=Pleurotus ostreatus TaxID=5322 RepID=A0A8H6ZNV4_PLEOS|nr:uncharacterized protein PC9H_008408 [Pleurotus ostreatus]KAF7426043.1 hypothetical protein PC9H_008408 [Pleurotus ostreatus]KAJ8693461.1 hypothetical protein PTI98_008452 [Pleurotus ostreatus]